MKYILLLPPVTYRMISNYCKMGTCAKFNVWTFLCLPFRYFQWFECLEIWEDWYKSTKIDSNRALLLTFGNTKFTIPIAVPVESKPPGCMVKGKVRLKVSLTNRRVEWWWGAWITITILCDLLVYIFYLLHVLITRWRLLQVITS